MSLSRRAFLGSAAAAGLSSLAAKTPALPKPRKEAKNVILIVVDGMAIQVASMWDHYSRQVNRTQSYWMELQNRSGFVHGLQATRSMNCIVTDSAAASSAWGSGRRVYNGALNMYPTGDKLTSIAQLAQAKGMKAGMASTARITHATPAGFAIQCPNRDLEDDIAALYFEDKFDVLLGGGARHFEPSLRRDKRDLAGDFFRAGYAVARTREEAMRVRSGKILGIFSNSHMPYSVDRDHDAAIQAKTPSLAEMTNKAIELLDNPNGFVLQVEAGRVDHAGHANDFAGLLFDQRDYEAAVKTAVEFAERDGDTLVIITTDHATGGPSLNGLGAEYTEANTALDAWQGMKASYEALQPRLMRAASAADAHDIVKESLGFNLTAEESAALAACAKGQFPVAGSRLLSNLTSSLGLILSNHNCVSWTSTNHTSDHVLLSAYGPGSHRLAGLVDNTALFDTMTAALGIRHRNPLVSPAEARRAAEVSANFWNENHA